MPKELHLPYGLAHIRTLLKGTSMTMRHIDDWTTLVGSTVEIRRPGWPALTGYVDAVTDDGTILWLLPVAATRKLYEKAQSLEVWATPPEPPDSKDTATSNNGET